MAGEIEKLKKEMIKPREQITLEPYERDHAVVIAQYRCASKICLATNLSVIYRLGQLTKFVNKPDTCVIAIFGLFVKISICNVFSCIYILFPAVFLRSFQEIYSFHIVFYQLCS